MKAIDLATSVATKKDWKGHSDLTLDDSVIVFEPTTNKLIESNVIDASVIEGDFDCVSYGEGKSKLSLLATEACTVPHASKYAAQKSKPRNPLWKLSSLSKLVAEKDSIYTPTSGYKNQDGVCLPEYDLRFIGLWLTDGNTNKSSGGISISQSEHQTIENEYIVNVLENCGFSYKLYEVGGYTNFKENGRRMNYTIHRGCIDGKRDPNGVSRLDYILTKNFHTDLMAMTKDQMTYVLDSAYIGNGFKSKTSYKRGEKLWNQNVFSFCTSNKSFAYRFNLLSTFNGVNSTVSSIDRSNINGKTIYICRVELKTNKIYRCLGGQTYSDRDSMKRVTHKGLMWNVKHELQHLPVVCERNGKTVMVGM